MGNEIRTSRLVLRQLEVEEARALATGRNDGLLPAARGYPLEGTLASASMVLRRHDSRVDMGDYGSYQIVRRSDGLVVGDIGFHGPPDSRGAVTIGYGLAPEARGHGYATESLVALVEWALAQPEVTAVNADANLDNVASQRVMERAGMRFSHETTEKRFYHLP
jgi:RimJ/RimL family protein N-acetyltransferase